MTKRKEAIGYCRVSTVEQATEGVSLDAQEARIRAWATAHGYAMRGIRIDRGRSAKTTEGRPELHAALEECCKHGAALVAVKLDRIARNTRDALEILDRLREHDSDFVLIDNAIDSTTPVGRMFFTLIAAFAAFERDMIASRTKDALTHKRGKGEALGNTPFGYMRAGADLAEHPIEHPVRTRILLYADQGLSFRAIAANLNRSLTPARDGGKWRHSQVARIVRRTEVVLPLGSPASISGGLPDDRASA